MNSGKILRDIFCIMIISIFSGFVLGLILAPMTGKNFKKYMMCKIRDIVDRGKFTIVEAKVRAEELIEKGKEKVEEVSAKMN
jgi:polyhydroxyalkanoate synthesis regulator phasin